MAISTTFLQMMEAKFIYQEQEVDGVQPMILQLMTVTPCSISAFLVHSLPIGGGSYKSLFSPGKIYAMVSLGGYVYGVCGGDLCRINPVDKTKTNLGFGTAFTSVTDIGVKNSLLYVFKNGVYMINPITPSNSFMKPADYPGDPVAVTLVSATNEFAMLVNDIIYTYSPATKSFTSYAESLGTWEGAKSLRNKPGTPSYYLYTVKGDGGFYKIDLASKTATLLASGFSVNPTSLHDNPKNRYTSG